MQHPDHAEALIYRQFRAAESRPTSPDTSWVRAGVFRTYNVQRGHGHPQILSRSIDHLDKNRLDAVSAAVFRDRQSF